MKRFRAISNHTLWSNTAGSSLVEFAVAIAVLLTAIVTIVNGALALYAYHYVANAARDGARYAMVRGSGWAGAACAAPSSYSCTASGASVKSYLVSVAPGALKTANIAVATTWPGTTASGGACYLGNGTNGAGCSVTVAVTYIFDVSLPLVPKKALQLSSTSTMPITQ